MSNDDRYLVYISHPVSNGWLYLDSAETLDAAKERGHDYLKRFREIGSSFQIREVSVVEEVAFNVNE